MCIVSSKVTESIILGHPVLCVIEYYSGTTCVLCKVSSNVAESIILGQPVLYV